MEGKIVWANGASVKIRWDDGEQVTWKRAELASKGLEFLDDATEQPEAIGAEAEQKPLSLVEEVPAEPIVATNAQPAAIAEAYASPTAPAETSAKPESTPAKKPRAKHVGNGQTKKLSALDAAAKILAESGQPMNCQEMIDAMAAKGYWSSPGGKTPAATLYSSILRELSKGTESRFVKTTRGKFAFKS